MTGVREAEERLAAIARALQSAYEEEVREATQARDAAGRNLMRAQAMEQASRSLGHEDLTTRLLEVIEQLRTAHNAATARLAELAGIEKTVQMRLNEAEATPPPAPQLPAPAPAAPVAKTLEPMPLSNLVPSATIPLASPPAAVTIPPKKAEDELLTKQQQLITRMEELERLAPKWPKDVARLAVQEHVALARLLIKKFGSTNRASEDKLTPVLGRLRLLSASLGLTDITGWSADDTVDWNKVAADARARRTAFVEARKKEPNAPPSSRN